MSYKEYKKKKLEGDTTLQSEYLRLSRQRALAYSLAKQIKKERLARNLTQAGLAERVGTHQSGIARIEGGSTLPSMSFLFALAEALQCEAKFFLLPFQTSKEEVITQKGNQSDVTFWMSELSTEAPEAGNEPMITNLDPTEQN